jgi:hypothetical protein
LDWLTVRTTEYETSHATTSQGKSKADTGREQAYVILLGHRYTNSVLSTTFPFYGLQADKLNHDESTFFFLDRIAMSSNALINLKVWVDW